MINAYNTTYQNMTLIPTANNILLLNLSGFNNGISLTVKKDDISEDTTIADGDGRVVYSTSILSQNIPVQYEFIQQVSTLTISLTNPSNLQNYDYTPTLVVSPFTA